MAKPHDLTRQAVNSAVARLLRAERERQGLSMSVVAERAGISQQMVSYVERELRKPTLDTLLRMAHALDIKMPALVERACTAGTNAGKKLK